MRKLAPEKKAKESAAIAKLPKNNQLFSAVPSKSSGIATTRDISDDETRQSDYQIHSSLPYDNQGQDETVESDFDADIIDISLQEVESSCESIQSPNDAGLWNIQTDIKSLQIYWIDKDIL